MNSLFIKGGKTLKGEVRICGSKNAVLPIIFSCVAVRGISRIANAPDIGDVRIALRLIERLGAKVRRRDNVLFIDTRALTYTELPEEETSKIRASSYLLGASLARFGKAKIYSFGGCKFDSRPIDMHLGAFSALGARVDGDVIFADELKCAEIKFDKPSVGATINAVIAASAAEGVSKIYGYAKEPHVFSLLDFFKKAGIKINVCNEYIELEGGKTYGSDISVIPDMIEAGTYIMASLITESPFLISSSDPAHLLSLTDLLERSGVNFSFTEKGIIPYGRPVRPVDIITAPYPAYPTDLQPQAAPLLAVSMGGTITETVWKGRFAYLTELEKFGLKYEKNGDRAVIFKSNLTSASASATDLRGGAALILAALYASGESEIRSLDIIERGYENIMEKLVSLGADAEKRTV